MQVRSVEPPVRYWSAVATTPLPMSPTGSWSPLKSRMGSEVAAKSGQELAFSIEVYGTNVLSGVEVFRFQFGRERGWESGLNAFKRS